MLGTAVAEVGSANANSALARKQAALKAVVRSLERAGWELRDVAIDLTCEQPIVEVVAIRSDGYWIRAYSDRLGRASIDRFIRQRTLGMSADQVGRRPMIPLVNDQFIGRARYPGARSMLRAMCSLLSNGSEAMASVSEMRRSWGAVLTEGADKELLSQIPSPSLSGA